MPLPWTKGPLKVVSDAELHALIVQAEAGTEIAYFYVDEEDSDWCKEQAANATLFVAANELYEALVMVRDADNDCKADDKPSIPAMARAKIDAAIAKAEQP